MLKNMKISFKIMALTVIIIVSLSIAFIFAFKMIKDTLLEQNSQGTFQVINQTANNMQIRLENLDSLAMEISRDDEIAQNIIDLDAADQEEKISRYEASIKNLLSEYVDSNMDIDCALVVTQKHKTSVSGQKSVRNGTVIEEINSLNTFEDSKMKSMWFDTYTQDLDLVSSSATLGGRVITLAKSIYSTTSLKSLGTLYLFIRESAISNVIEDVNLTSNGMFYVVGNSGNIIYNINNVEHNTSMLKAINTPENKEYRYVSESVLDRIKQNTSKHNMFTESVNGDKSVITYSTINEIVGTPLGWTIVSVTKTEDVFASISGILNRLVILSLICLTIGLLISFFITRDITLAFNKLMGKMDEIKKGNLDIEFTHDRKDEIGILEKSFENMVCSLKDIINKVRSASHVSIDSSQTVSASCEESYASIQELNTLIQMLDEDFQKQSSSVLVGNNQIGVIKEKIGRAKGNIEVTDEIVLKSRQLSDLNRNSVTLLYNMSNNIKKAMDNISMEFKELITASSEIGIITQSITKISEQTKLLALNASIESAKAGVYGKSFALVAGEIKKLSVQTKEFVLNIDQKVKNIVGKIETAGSSVTSLSGVVNESEHTITSVVDSFDSNSNFLNKIVSQIENIKDSINSIDSSGNDIITIIKDISESIESDIDCMKNINATTNQQFRMVEQLVGKSEELLNIAHELEAVVNNFNV